MASENLGQVLGSRIIRVSWGGLGAVLKRLWGYWKGTWLSRKAGKKYWVHSKGFAGCWGLRVVFWECRARSPGDCRRLGAVCGATQRMWLNLVVSKTGLGRGLLVPVRFLGAWWPVRPFDS